MVPWGSRAESGKNAEVAQGLRSAEAEGVVSAPPRKRAAGSKPDRGRSVLIVRACASAAAVALPGPIFERGDGAHHLIHIPSESSDCGVLGRDLELKTIHVRLSDPVFEKVKDDDRSDFWVIPEIG